MNTKENKHTLWELSKPFFLSGMRRDEIIEVFESLVKKVDDQCRGDLTEKNKAFLLQFVDALASIKVETGDPVIEVIEVKTENDLELRLSRLEEQVLEILKIVKGNVCQTPLP